MYQSRALTSALRAAALRTLVGPSRTAIRRYATPSSSQDARPPKELFGIDGTYASALFTAAVKTNTLEPTAKALDSLHNTFTKDPKLHTILQAPTLSAEDKQQLVNELVKTSGAPSSDKTVANLLKTLADNNRLSVLDGVCIKFADLMAAHRGEIEMTVTSAATLDQKVLRQLETAVGKSEYVGQGKKLKVVAKVNPDIRGGLVVEIGDRTIDLSVSSKMAKMNKLLQETL